MSQRSDSTASPNMLLSFANWLRYTVTGTAPERQTIISAYLARKRELPQEFTSKDWHRAQDYWGHKCAICERPRGLWHTLAQDHWIPLTSADCPGTTATNILPLCHGTEGCNNSKGKNNPEKWLKRKLGRRRAAAKLQEIYTYFEWVKEFRGNR